MVDILASNIYITDEWMWRILCFLLCPSLSIKGNFKNRLNLYCLTCSDLIFILLCCYRRVLIGPTSSTEKRRNRWVPHNRACQLIGIIFLCIGNSQLYNTILNWNLIGCSTLSQDYCQLIGLYWKIIRSQQWTSSCWK